MWTESPFPNPRRRRARLNRELAALKTALHIARRKHLLNRIVEWDKLPELNVREGFLDYDEYQRLLAELPDELKLLLVLGYHYGIRKGELLTYCWDYVSWFAKELRIPQSDTKNKQPKIISFYGGCRWRSPGTIVRTLMHLGFFPAMANQSKTSGLHGGQPVSELI